VIILGVILLIIGLVVGMALALLGMAVHAVGGRRHYYWPTAGVGR
jgi:hypothetical protein